MRVNQTLGSTLLIAVALGLSLVLAEGVLWLKNSSMQNYDIEMWRYARELKQSSADPALGHEHVKNRSAVLQSVEIRINEWGLRGGKVDPLPPGGRRILVLGGSITLGWGVPEEKTMTAQLQAMFEAEGKQVQVLNAGVGNYNAERYVGRFFRDLAALKPTDIVVHYFLRDAEQLDPGGGNIFLRNSELAVTLWIAVHRLFDRQGNQALEDHYAAVYRQDAPGFLAMKAALGRLADYARENGIRIFLAMVPDVHNLADYKLTPVHDRMRQISGELGYTYLDLLPVFGKLKPEEVWAMPGDPHPNALGHKLMAEALFPVLRAAE